MDTNELLKCKEELEAKQIWKMVYLPSKTYNKKKKSLFIFYTTEYDQFFEFYHNPFEDIYYCKVCNGKGPCVAIKMLPDPESPRKKRFHFVTGDTSDEESTDDENEEEEEKEEVEIVQPSPKKKLSAAAKKKRSSGRKNSRIEDDGVQPPPKKKKLSPAAKKRSGRVIASVDEHPKPKFYEVVNVLYKGQKVVKRLRIYTSGRKVKLYEFCYDQRKDIYHCKDCLARGTTFSIRIVDGPDGKEQFKYFKTTEHVCEPLKIADVLEKITEEVENGEEATMEVDDDDEEPQEAATTMEVVAAEEAEARRPFLSFIVAPPVLNISHNKDSAANADDKDATSTTPKKVSFAIVPSIIQEKVPAVAALKASSSPSEDVIYLSDSGDEDEIVIVEEKEPTPTPQLVPRIIEKKLLFLEDILKEDRTDGKRLYFSDPMYGYRPFAYYLDDLGSYYFCKECQKKGQHVYGVMEEATGNLKLSTNSHVCL